MSNKYNAKRTWSELAQRWFASRLEAGRADELCLFERAREISDLRYQVKFVLSKIPRVSITIDFCYLENGKRVYEDSKGILTRDSRTKLAWLEQLHGIHVNIVK